MPELENHYIIASCKEWHKEGFHELSHGLGELRKLHWVEQPCKLKDAIAKYNPRYVFFLHWNWIVPREIWSRYESVCFHMTDVPYGRGGSPLQNMIERGHKNTKVTAFRMTEVLDGGPVYAKRFLSLEGRAQEIYQRAGLISYEIIRWMIETQPEPTPQKGEVVKFSRRVPGQSLLPGRGELEDIYNHIRMLDAETYPLAFLNHGDFILTFSNARMRKDGAVSAEVVIKNLKK